MPKACTALRSSNAACASYDPTTAAGAEKSRDQCSVTRDESQCYQPSGTGAAIPRSRMAGGGSHVAANGRRASGGGMAAPRSPGESPEVGGLAQAGSGPSGCLVRRWCWRELVRARTQPTGRVAPPPPSSRRRGWGRGAGPWRSPSEELALHGSSYDGEGRVRPLLGRCRQAVLQEAQAEQVVLTLTR